MAVKPVEREAQMTADQRRLDYAVRLSGIGFWYCDLPFDELIWDERVKSHFFLPPDARVTIDTFYERIVPADRERTRAAIEASIRDRTHYDIVYTTHDPATGAVKWIRAMGGTTYAPDGSPTRFDGVTVDVSKQRREEARLLALLEQVPAIVNVLRGPDLVWSFAHPKALEALKKTRDIVGRPLLETVPELADQPFPARLRQVYETGESFTQREALAWNVVDGRRVETYWTSVYQPVRDASGRIEGVMSFDIDVTEQVRARQEAARVKEVQWRVVEELFNASPAPICLFRGDELVIEFANQRCVDVLQRRVAGDIVGKRLLDALPELRGQGFDDLLRRVIATGQSHVGKDAPAVLRREDGTPVTVYFDYVFAPIGNDAGVIDGVSVYAFDVSEQVATRQRLEAANRDLALAGRAKDEFLATMSHELRTPLNAMLGWAMMLRRSPHDPSKIDRGLTVIERNAQTQARLVSDLMDVSRIITGKLRLNLKKTELATAIHAAVDVVRPAADARGLALRLDLDPDLGALAADPDRLQQIVWNLLSNAVRFTSREGSVTVRALRSDSKVSIEVVDTGAGIPAEHLPYVFDRFRQVDSSTTRAHGGLGLGLAIVRYLAEAHGGTVKAASDGPDRGSTFTVVLPVRSLVAEVGERPAPRRAAETSNPPADTEARLGGVRVLVVEDERDSRELIGVVLEEAGAEVTMATSASEALAERGPFDVIVSDIGMPEMDGYAFMRAFRARDADRDVPAIALTAYARQEDVDRALRSGYQQHLAKPLEPSLLVAVVETVTRPRA